MGDMVYCQSCGMPLTKDEEKGTNADGSLSNEYCVYCYKNGEFTMDLTLEQAVEHNLQYLDEWNKSLERPLTVDEARRQLSEFLPTLKRWSQN